MSAPTTAVTPATTTTGRTTSPVPPGASPQAVGLVLAIVSAIAFAGSAPFAKLLLGIGWSSGAVVSTRALVGGLVLLPFAAWAVRRDPAVVVRHWKLVLGYGLIAVAASQFFYYGAIERLPVSVAMLVMYLAPVLLLLLSWITTRRRPALLALAGAACCIGGLTLVLDLSGGGAIDGMGIMSAVLAAVGTAGYFLLASSAPAGFPPIALVCAGPLVAAGGYAVLAPTGLLPLRFVFDEPIAFLGGASPWWVPFGILVVIGTATAYALGLAAATRLGSRLASFAGLAEIPATFGVAALLLGEVPTPIQVAGTLLILTGVVAVRVAPDRQAILAARDAVLAAVTGSIPTVTGAIPVVTGPIPTVTGAIPVVTGPIPIIASTSQIPLVSATLPAYEDEAADLEVLEDAFEWADAQAAERAAADDSAT